MQLAFNTSTGEWMLPAWSRGGHAEGIVNLYVWRTSFDAETRKPRRQIYSGPTFKQHAYGIHRLRDGGRPIVVLEGHWDYLAFCSLLSATKMLPKYDCIGKPGSAFPKSSLSIFNGREVILMFDNDPAGEAGVESICKSMTANGVIPSSLRILKWPEGLDRGFDVSDVITKLPTKFIKKVKK
jgi:Toprim-like